MEKFTIHILSVIVLTVACQSACGEEEKDAFNLFFDACRSRNSVSNSLQSAKAELVYTSFLQSQIFTRDELIETFGLSQPSDEKETKLSPKEELLKKRIDQIYDEQHSQNNSGNFDDDQNKSLIKVLISGSHPFTGKRREEKRQFIPKIDSVKPTITLSVGNPNIPSSCLHIRWTEIDQTISVGQQFIPATEFYRFGRIQISSVTPSLGETATEVNNEGDFFSENGRQSLRQKMLDEGLTFHYHGETKYDESNTASIVSIKKDGNDIIRLHIDSSRGNICPLVELFQVSAEGVACRSDEYSSSNFFFHSKANCWFPTNFTHSRFSCEIDQKGMLQSKNQYAMSEQKIQWNQPVDNSEFYVDVPAGAKVFDRRKGQIKYQAIKEGTLTLGEGSELRLDNLDWLLKEGDLPSYSQEGLGRWRWPLVICGGLLILAGTIMKARSVLTRGNQ